jgi:GNAT superfamily N-acetyltransferase
MQLTIRAIGEAEATDASAVIHASFMKLAAPDWEPNAQNVFLSESSPDVMARKLKAAVLSFGAFTGKQMIGVLLMPTPNILGMLFVHPAWLRRGIARSLWEHTRAEIERTFPTVKTIELNSTPYAIDFYRSAGFATISSEFELSDCRATRMACWLPARALGAEKALYE